jgi:hypothetical protein
VAATIRSSRHFAPAAEAEEYNKQLVRQFVKESEKDALRRQRREPFRRRDRNGGRRDRNR